MICRESVAVELSAPKEHVRLGFRQDGVDRESEEEGPDWVPLLGTTHTVQAQVP